MRLGCLLAYANPFPSLPFPFWAKRSVHAQGHHPWRRTCSSYPCGGTQSSRPRLGSGQSSRGTRHVDARHNPQQGLLVLQNPSCHHDCQQNVDDMLPRAASRTHTCAFSLAILRPFLPVPERVSHKRKAALSEPPNLRSAEHISASLVDRSINNKPQDRVGYKACPARSHHPPSPPSHFSEPCSAMCACLHAHVHSSTIPTTHPSAEQQRTVANRMRAM